MNELTIRRTDFLFSSPSFIIGAGSVLNILGNYFDYNDSPTGIEADLKAIESDWQNIGADIENTIKIFDKEKTPQIELNFND